MKKMNKKLPAMALALALILLAGCGGAEFENYTSLSPKPKAPEPVAAETDVLPDVGFEIDTVWYSAGFGEDGRAVLFLGEPGEETIDAALFIAQHCYDDGNYRMLTLDNTTTAVRNGDGWRFDYWGVSVLLTADGDMLSASYEIDESIPEPLTSEEFWIDENGNAVRRWTRYADFTFLSYYPSGFMPVQKSEAGLVWCSMPMFICEIESPLPRIGYIADITAILGDENLEIEGDYFRIDNEDISVSGFISADGRRYNDLSLSSSDPEFAPKIRGITIGCSFLDAVLRFPMYPERFYTSNMRYGCYMHGDDLSYIVGNGMTLCNGYYMNIRADKNGIVDYISVFPIT